MILALRTDTAVAQLELLGQGNKIVAHDEWEAGRALSVQLPARIDELLKSANTSYEGLEGVVVYPGPGSFTGLRIGITIANTIAHTQNIPIVGSSGENWIKDGMTKLRTASARTIITPQYGGEANITKPKK